MTNVKAQLIKNLTRKFTKPKNRKKNVELMNDKRTNKNMMQVQGKTKIASDTSALLAALSWSHEDAADMHCKKIEMHGNVCRVQSRALIYIHQSCVKSRKEKMQMQ